MKPLFLILFLVTLPVVNAGTTDTTFAPDSTLDEASFLDSDLNASELDLNHLKPCCYNWVEISKDNKTIGRSSANKCIMVDQRDSCPYSYTSVNKDGATSIYSKRTTIRR